MRKINLLACLAIVLLSTTLINAQATRTWVSGVGDDANPCSRTAPCKTFAGAISKTAVGGEIDALDPGGFGALTITKSITLDGGGGQVASILVAGTNGIVVQTPNATDVVIIRNLRFDGIHAAAGNQGLNGIRFLTGGSLYIENCEIFGFNQNGIDIETGGTDTLTYISNTAVTENTLSGILVKPGSNSAHVALFGARADQNGQGVVIGGTGGAGAATVTIWGSSANMNATGVNASGVGGGTQQLVIGNSQVTLNGTGVSVTAPATGVSNGNNQINQNGTDINGTLTNQGTK